MSKKWGSLLALLVLLEVLSIALYLGKAGQFGFPLDDAWIHQTYARNLGLHGTMAFTPGQPSTGSTSFGWTLLLAAGYWLKIPFFWWTYFLGASFAVATALIAAHLAENYFGSFRNVVIVALICLFEWHLAWAAVSGMEIGLFTFLVMLFFLLLHRDTSPLLVGTLVGIIVLVRPEGVLFAAIYGLKLIFAEPRQIKRILFDGVTFLLAFSIITSPWILFNLFYSHRPFPNTIAAKFIQYGYPWSLWKSLKYVWDVFIYFLNGPLLLLVPGAGFCVYNSVKARNTPTLYPFAWSLILISLYAITVPAIYDHGRYLMPIIPFIIIYGVQGLEQLLNRFLHRPLLRSAIWLSQGAMVLLLWINGASDYAYRTQLFEIVHVPAAEWINAHTPRDAVIATHDIGIIGYYTERQIVDLAGLVTPEILPIMADQQKMVDYLKTRQVTHVLVYTGYYRGLLTALDARVVFSPGAERLREMGVEPFEIHEVSR
jgi:hypothetical protein